MKLFKSVGQIMRSPVHGLDPKTSLGQAIRFFDERMISGAPVLCEEGKVIGVLSRTDLLTYLAHGSSLERPVHEVMTPYAFLLGPDEPMMRALDFMLESKIHRVVISDGEGRPLGMVTTLDLLEEMRDLLAQTLFEG